MLLYFRIADEVVIVKIAGHSLLFSDIKTNFQNFYPIEAIRLDIQGCLKENPDLLGLNDSEIRSESIFRLKAHLAGLDNENSIRDYVTAEMSKMGYTLIATQREGFRKIPVK